MADHTACEGHRTSDRWWTLLAPVYDTAVALVGWHRCQDALLADVESVLLLDVGCGPAHLARGPLRRGVRYIGVDRNTAMLARASRQLASASGGGTVVRADITALPFRDHTFDIVVATGVLGLLDIDTRRTALREVARVARSTLRLLEPVRRADAPHRRATFRLIALVRDRPIDLAELFEAGFTPELRGPPAIARLYSMVNATRH